MLQALEGRRKEGKWIIGEYLRDKVARLTGKRAAALCSTKLYMLREGGTHVIKALSPPSINITPPMPRTTVSPRFVSRQPPSCATALPVSPLIPVKSVRAFQSQMS